MNTKTDEEKAEYDVFSSKQGETCGFHFWGRWQVPVLRPDVGIGRREFFGTCRTTRAPSVGNVLWKQPLFFWALRTNVGPREMSNS